MSLEAALRLTEILLAIAFLQASAEHVLGPARHRWLFAPRLVLSGLLLAGVAVPWTLLALCLHGLWLLHRFDGPYNGGSDRMGLLILTCLTVAHWGAPAPALGYLALQVALSYAISGQVKLTNPDWRSGQALVDVFAFSAYPVSEGLRRLADRPGLLRIGARGVIALELLFPLALMHQGALLGALALTALFHLANACLFGLNRFVWAWLAAYPSLLWLQTRIGQLIPG